MYRINNQHKKFHVQSLGMGMTPVEQAFCARCLEKLQNHPLAFAFLEKVDPVRDHVPDYFDVIEEPMDLGTVEERLKDGVYDSSEQFIRDVNLIWRNSITYNRRNQSPLEQIAEEMNKKCSRMFAKGRVPKTEADEWSRKVASVNKKMTRLLKIPLKDGAIVARLNENELK